MPAPDAAIVAYAVIIVVPLLIVGWYWAMYSDIGRAGLTGGEHSERRSELDPDREAEPET